MLYFEPNQRRIVQEILIERNNQKKRPALGDSLFIQACEKVFAASEGISDNTRERDLLVKIAAIAVSGIEMIDKRAKESSCIAGNRK
jgi:hypothetical protein